MLNLRRSGGSARMANEDLHRQDAKDGQSANDLEQWLKDGKEEMGQVLKHGK